MRLEEEVREELAKIVTERGRLRGSDPVMDDALADAALALSWVLDRFPGGLVVFLKERARPSRYAIGSPGSVPTVVADGMRGMERGR
jgi:hypothetical protein